MSSLSPTHQKAAQSSLRTRIFYSDNNQEMVDGDTEYSERIQVTTDQQGSVLTLQDVRLPDEREFICQVNGLAAGNAEARTHLRVFGEWGSGDRGPTLRGPALPPQRSSTPRPSKTILSSFLLRSLCF